MRLSDGDYLILSDIQAPYHDKRAVGAVANFAAQYQFDGALCVGDEADQAEVARWTKATVMEYMDTFEAGLTVTYDVLADFRDALRDAPFHMMRSNHTDRIKNYLTKYAPAMSGVSWNRYETIMGFTDYPLLKDRNMPLGITFHDKPWQFAKGYTLAHGDETASIRSPGGTALSLAKKFGTSVVCGHTHKLGQQHAHMSSAGKINHELWGYEVGHLMDMKKAGYLKGGHGNWQQGFAVCYIRNGACTVSLVPIRGRSFIFQGERVTW